MRIGFSNRITLDTIIHAQRLPRKSGSNWSFISTINFYYTWTKICQNFGDRVIQKLYLYSLCIAHIIVFFYQCWILHDEMTAYSCNEFTPILPSFYPCYSYCMILSSCCVCLYFMSWPFLLHIYIFIGIISHLWNIYYYYITLL